jgi:hypothetical protein
VSTAAFFGDDQVAGVVDPGPWFIARCTMLIEDGLDAAARNLGLTVAVPRRWSVWVRVLRSLAQTVSFRAKRPT